jgi:hypothetical protein
MNGACWTALVAGGLLCAAQSASPPRGPSGLDVLPSLIEVTVRPGSLVERDVMLINPTAGPLTVSARVSDWQMSQAGEIRFAAPGTEPLSCGGWIRVEPARIVVAERGRATVRVTIASAADFSGTRWAAVLFSLPEVPAALDGRPVLLAGRVGLTLYVTAEGTEREAIELVGSSATATPRRKACLTANLENHGNTAVRLRMSWQIRASDGAIVATHETRAVSLPGARRAVVATIPDELAPGTYRVTVMARWGSKSWQASDCDLVVPEKPRID